MNIQKEPTAALRKRRNVLVRQLPPLQAVLRGSLIERYKRCGKPGCKCTDGPGHGPKYYLSISYPNGAGSFPPAGGHAGSTTQVGPDVF